MQDLVKQIPPEVLAIVESLRIPEQALLWDQVGEGEATQDHKVLSALAVAYPSPSIAEFQPIGGIYKAIKAVWQRLEPATAAAYVAAVREAEEFVLHQLKPLATPARSRPHAIPSRKIGAFYEADGYLGCGACGQALSARDTRTGERVTIKVGAGSEAAAFRWFDEKLPAQFLQVYDWGKEEVRFWWRPELAEEPVYIDWVAREYADETWAEYMERRHGKPVNLAEALSIFEIACEGVSALHDAQCYQWSSHARNIFRVGSRWKLGDLSRNCFAATPDDPRLARLLILLGCSDVERSAILCEWNAGPWENDREGFLFPRDPEREYRLKLDDCSMLAGLLCDLLGLNRWQVFYQAIGHKPYCNGTYMLTGHRGRDRALSKVINRAWLGDAGGALAVANGVQVQGYADPRELLRDVSDALTR